MAQIIIVSIIRMMMMMLTARQQSCIHHREFLWYSKYSFRLLHKFYFVTLCINLSLSDWIIQIIFVRLIVIQQWKHEGTQTTLLSSVDMENLTFWRRSTSHLEQEKHRDRSTLFVWNWRLKKYFEMCFKFSNFSTKYLHE